MRKISIIALCTLLSAQLMASPSLMIDAMGKLNFLDDSGNLAKSIDKGSIAADIELGDQKFRVSYGRDLQGNPNIIIYSNPTNPSNISLRGFGKEIKILDGGVLTIVATPDGNDAMLKSGLLGKVQVGGQTMQPNSVVNIGGGQITQQPIFQQAEMVKKSASGQATTQSGLLKLGATAHRVSGTVMVTYPGQQERPLVAGDVLQEGAIIRTGADGNVYLSPYPQSLAWLEPSSEMEILKLAPDASAGLDANILLGLKQGTITSTLRGIDHSKVSYKIKTPRGVAAARGTTFTVTADGNVIVCSVTEGNITVNLDGGSVSMDISNGFEATFTPNGGAPQQLPMNAQRIALINNIIEVYRQIFGNLGEGGEFDEIEGVGDTDIGDALSDLIDNLEDALDDIDDDLDDDDTTPTS
ncbi:MAG: FecR domain-containing protein [Verrucomicrobiota bacterium]